MRLQWSETSLRDRDEIFDYIEEDSAQAAADNDLQIRDHARELIRYPEAGRAGRVRGSRELVVPGTSYIIAYRIRRDRVEILRVLHGARRWPRRFKV